MLKTMLIGGIPMIVSNEEKKRTIIPFIFVAIIAPILTCLVIPLYESYVSESLSRFDSPFLDMTVQMAMHNQIIGIDSKLCFC